MGSIADSILKGTYGKNSPQKSSVADMIIDGSYSERVRKQREEEEEKRRAERERQKKINEAKTTTNVLPKANSNFSNLEDLQKEYDKLSITEQAEMAKQINSKTGTEKLALSSNKVNNTPLINLDETKLKSEKDLKIDNLKTDAKAIGSNLLNSAKVGGTQLLKSMAMNVDKTQNMYIDAGNKMNEMIIKEMEKEGKDTSHLKQVYREKYDSKPFYQEKINKLNQKMAENTEKATNPTSKKIAEISQGLGNNIVGAVATAINPTAGLIYFTGSAKGSYYDEAIQRGMSEEEAENYSGVMALMEGVTERYLAGENIKGFKNILKGQGFKNAVKSFGIEVGENFVQEAVMPSISEVTALATAGKEHLNYDFTTAEGWENLLTDSWSDGIDGALSSIMLNGSTKGVASATRVINKMRNGQTVTQQEIATAVEDSQKAGVDVEGILQEEIKNVAEKKVSQEATMANQNNQTLQNNIDTNIENTQGQINSELNEILNNKELPMQGYKYESSNNAKINNLRQQAGKYFNNSQEAHKFVDMLEKIIVDKDIEIRLDANLKTVDGRVANGSYSNGVITINPNSSRTGEFIAIHELTHAIGTKSMMNIVENYRKSNAEFNSAVESLLQNYKATELTEEALSDVSAQLFGNQEFINNIANTNPGFFKKIYNEIKYLWHQFRGYKNQNQFVEDLYYKWTQAYNSNNKLNGTNNYSIAGINAVNNIRNNTDLYNQAMDNYNLAKKMAKQGKNNVEIMEKTGWFKDDTGKLKFSFSDKDMSLKNINFKEGEVYTLEQILNHDTLFMFYPELKYYTVEFKDLNKGRKEGESRLNGAFSRKDKEIRLDINRANFKMDTEGTLIHEIQHAIQNIEGFTRGTSIKAGKRQYQRSLGEREARDTANRFINEKYNGFDMSNVLPESAIFNRNILDKMKDAVYNYFNKFNQGVSNEEVGETNKENSKRNKILVVDGINGQENSNKSSFSMDNQGRILTKEQQEYFKDSKARDNKGNLLELYHGTPYEFNQFNYSKLGENTSSLGAGFYFTDNYKTAEEYKRNNGNLKRVYLDIKKPLKYGETTITKSEYKKFIEAINKETNGMFLEDYDGIENALMEYDYGGDDIDLVSAVQSASGLTHEKTFEILRDTIGYDGIISDKGFLNKDETLYVVFNANQIKNVNNTNPTSNPDIRYSQNNESWQQHLDKNFKPTGTRTNMKDIGINVAPTAKNNVAPSIGNVEYRQKKTMNPTEISNLKLDDASTTPKLPQRKYKEGNKQSSFLSNIITDSKFLNEDLRQQMGKEDNIRYYQGITNEKTLENAYNKLQKDGQSEVIKWHSKDSKNANAEDVAEGWILLKQYQDNGDYQSAVEVAKKMRDIGTTAGQTVQAYNILSRLTPEGMFYYAQSELNEAYNKMVEGKSKKWIEENQSKFDLTPEETQSILDIMKDVSTMEDGYDKKVKLAEVQKIITNKIPPTAGESIKAWMRISMLFNPKTQVRNVMGNAVILPVNMFSDSVSAGIDKLIAKKTGVRTTGNINLKNYGKGFGKGLYESYNDFRKSINTRNIEGNRFEVSEGKNFKDNGIGKAVNRVDNLLSFMLDAGDRGFYEATFVNSLNNQMVLNNVSTPTAEMIEIATNEALQRTWQDNNKYTQSVLKIRNILNNVNVKGYGLGDVIIPFAKTPANLTKAIVDYSPAGLVKTLAIDARKLKNSLENGQFTAKTQHQFVQNLGKATAGTFLYVLAYGLAKAGIATGEADEDKDVKNFMKNSLGISSYSIKIGDKSFTYDWAQPIAAPLSIMTNIVNSKDKGQALLEGIVGNLDTAGGILLEQSFLESFNEVLNDNDGFVSGLINQTLELPARAVPTFSKQITDMVDGTQRTTFEYGKPIKSAFNSIVAKIPGASKTLPASIDTLGNEIQKYGGNNNIFNVMFNPANTNKGKLSKAGEEIYNVYNQTGDKTIFPRTAPYYINSKGEKKTMDAHQRSDFQTISGKYVENSLSSLLKDKDYKKLSNDEKANIINEIVSDSYSKAKYDVLKIDSKEYEKLRTILKDVKPSTYYNYKFKTENMKKDRDKIGVLADSNYTNKEKTALYENYVGKDDNVYKLLKSTNISITEYLKYRTQEFSADYKDNGTLKGESISGSKKAKEWNYIDNMNISYTQKLLLLGYYSEYTLNDSQQKHVINYIKSLPNKNNEEKAEILSHFKGITIYKNGTVEY